jgi:hypothetical protein
MKSPNFNPEGEDMFFRYVSYPHTSPDDVATLKTIDISFIQSTQEIVLCFHMLTETRLASETSCEF